MNRYTRWMWLVLVLVVPGTAFAGGVRVAPGLEAGDSWVYELKYELERGLVQGAGRDRLVQEAAVAMEVTELSDDGTASIHGRFRWVVLDLDRASFRVRVDSREILGDSPNLAETTIREMVQDYLDAELTFQVSPDGTIGEIAGLGAIEEMIATKNGTLATLAAGRLLPETLRRDLEPIWKGDGAAGRTLSVGDTWEESRTSPLGAGVSMTLTTAWEVTKADADEVAYEGPVVAKVVLPELDAPMPVSFEVTEQDGSASSVWDVRAGVLKSREATTAYTVTVSVADQSQSSDRNGRSRLRLVESPASPATP